MAETTQKKTRKPRRSTDATPSTDKDEPIKRPRGRPSAYTPELAEEICRRVGQGESVRSIARDEHMPDEATIRGWAIDDVQGFFPQYTRACQIRAMRWADEITEIADEGSQDTYIDPATGNERVNGEIVARSRLRVDTRKWMLSKMLPKIYGDKIDVNHGGQAENPIQTTTRVVMVPAKTPADISVKPLKDE